MGAFYLVLKNNLSKLLKIKTMKKIFKALSLVVVIITVSSCSSVHIENSWKDIETNNLKDKNVMVLSKSNDNI